MVDISSTEQIIRDNRGRIDTCRDEITQLYRDISRLEEISQSILQKRQKMDAFQGRSLARLSAISALEINKKITSSYSEGMRETLTGKHYQDVHEGLTIANRRVHEKIYELQEEIRRKRLQINDMQNLISALRHDVNRAMSK